jgi:hypothetical protein
LEQPPPQKTAIGKAAVSLTSENPIQTPARNAEQAYVCNISGRLERHAMSTQIDQDNKQANRRQVERHRTLKHARIILSNRMSTFDCVIRNISTTGAMLEVPAPMGIPNHFELALGTDIHGPTCMIRWRTDHAIGVSFDVARQKAA